MSQAQTVESRLHTHNFVFSDFAKTGSLAPREFVGLFEILVRLFRFENNFRITYSIDHMSTQKELTVDDSDARKFNHNLIQLFDQMSKIYPEDQDLYIYRDKLAMLTKANFKLPSELFLKYAQDYVEEIMTCNQDFFLKVDTRTKMENSIYLELINKIIDLWLSSQDAPMKATIWKYMQVLLVLSIKTHRRVDLVIQVNKHRRNPLKI